MSNLAFQEKNWDELLNGQVVAMSPRPASNHNFTVGNIYRIFANYLKGKPCVAFVDGIDVYLTEMDRVIPDVLIVCNKDIIKKDGIHGTPDLIVEVLSPSTARKDKGYKKNLYEKCGVKEYWLVDINNFSIEVHLLKNSKFVLDDIYSIFPDYEINKMTDEEKNDIVYEFSPSLFPDMKILLEDVFENVF